MKELKRIVADMESVFAESNYPEDFLSAYDQMECLTSHTGRETFLVRRKADGKTAVAACYDRSVFPVHPDIHLLRDLNHPGLPHYYEQYQNEQFLCIIREYIEGETLAVHARDRQLNLDEITNISKQLCSILQELHTHVPPIVHRDIKPENIIVKPDRTLVLIDFDIARTVKEGAETDTVFFGTKGYAPPEQYGFGQTDSRADIYAFG
ncbi:MAG: protein kinase, partial [Clostridia bacterium]|nr:protein kinase [Clostridia bacterium]